MLDTLFFSGNSLRRRVSATAKYAKLSTDMHEKSGEFSADEAVASTPDQISHDPENSNRHVRREQLNQEILAYGYIRPKEHPLRPPETGHLGWYFDQQMVKDILSNHDETRAEGKYRQDTRQLGISVARAPNDALLFTIYEFPETPLGKRTFRSSAYFRASQQITTGILKAVRATQIFDFPSNRVVTDKYIVEHRYDPKLMKAEEQIQTELAARITKGTDGHRSHLESIEAVRRAQQTPELLLPSKEASPSVDGDALSGK